MPPATLTTNSESVALNLSPSLTIPLKATNSVAATTLVTAGTNVLSAAQDDDSGRVSTAQKEAARSIHEFIQKTQSSALGVVGMLLLVLVAIKMLANIEETFNDIWGVTRGRTWLSRIILYWTAITLGPLLLAFALGLASGPHFQSTKGLITNMPIIGGLIFQLLPLVVLWLVFAVVYQLRPHPTLGLLPGFVRRLVRGCCVHPVI